MRTELLVYKARLEERRENTSFNDKFVYDELIEFVDLLLNCPLPKEES